MVTRLEGATEPTEVLSAMKKLHSFKPDSIQSMDKIIQILGNTGYQYEPEILIYVIQYYCLNEHINSTLSNLLNVEKQFSKFKPGIKEQHLYANLIKSHLEQLKVPKKSPLKMMEYLRMAVERKIDLPERLILKCIITAGSHKNIAIVRELYEIYEKKMTPIMFNEIIHAAGNCGDMNRTQEYFELYQQKFKKQDSFVYVSFAKACVQNDQVPVALDILMKLVPAAGLKCEVRHFNSLLISLMHSGKFEDAEEVWEMMNDIDLGFLPNGNTFDLGVILYSSLNKYEKALKYYCKREKNWEKEWNLVSLGFGHFGLLCLEAKNLNLALEIFKKCGTAGNQLPLFAAICKQKELSSDQILEISSVALKDNKFARWLTPIYEKALSAAIKNEYRWDQALKIYNLFVGNEIRGDFATRKKMWELYIHNQDPKNSKLDSATYGWLFELAAENKAEGEGLTLRFRSIRKVFDEMMASNLKPSKKLYSNTMQALATDRYSSLKWRQLMLDNNIFTSEQVGTEIGRNIWSHFAMIEEHCENSDLEKAFELYEEVLKSFPNFHLFPSTFTKLLSLAVKNRNFPFAEKVITDTILKLTKSKEQRNTIFLKNVMRIGSNLGLNYKRNSLVYLVQEQSIKYLGKVDKNFEVSLTLLAGQPDRVEKLTKLKRALSAAEKDSSL